MSRLWSDTAAERAASSTCCCVGVLEEPPHKPKRFYLLPVDQKLIQYDKLAISTVVPTADHAISTCDIPFSTDLSQFQQDYLNLTRRVHDTGEAYNLAEEYMVIGTSALSQYDIDGAVNLYAGFYNNPFLIWGSIKGLSQTYPAALFSVPSHTVGRCSCRTIPLPPATRNSNHSEGFHRTEKP